MPQGKSLFFSFSFNWYWNWSKRYSKLHLVSLQHIFGFGKTKTTNSWWCDRSFSPNFHCQKQIERNQIYWIELFLCGFLATWHWIELSYVMSAGQITVWNNNVHRNVEGWNWTAGKNPFGTYNTPTYISFMVIIMAFLQRTVINQLQTHNIHTRSTVFDHKSIIRRLCMEIIQKSLKPN